METFDPTKFGATPLASTSSFDPTKFGATPIEAASPASTSPGFFTKTADNLAQGGVNIVKDVLGTEQNKSNNLVSQVAQTTYGSKGVAGVAQLPGRVAGAISEYGIAGIGGSHQAEKLQENASALEDHAYELLAQARIEQDPTKKATLRKAGIEFHKNADTIRKAADNITQYTDTTAGQALGTSLNAGLTVATGGLGSLEKTAGANLLGGVSPYLKALPKGASYLNGTTRALNYAGKIAENSLLGLGYNTAANLENGKPLTDNAGTTALVGGAIPVAGALASKTGEAITSKITPTAEGLINSLIKPLGRDFAYGKNPAQGIINEGIVAKDFNSLQSQVNTKISQVGQDIGTVGKKLTDSGVTLDLTKALSPLDEAMQTAAKNNNPTLLNSLHNVKIALENELGITLDETGVPSISKDKVRNITTATYQEAKDFLTNIADHTRFTGNPSDDKALNMATRRAYGIAREIMNTTADKVDPKLGTQIRDLNSRYGDLLSARNAINHRDIAMKRVNVLDLATKFAILPTVGYAILSGDYAKAGIALATEILAPKIAKSTAVKTGVAQFLSKLAPEERQGILNSTPIVKEYWERLTGNKSPGENAPKTLPLRAAEAPINALKNTPNKEGGFVSIGGKTFKEIPDATKAEMVKAIDYLRIGKKSAGIEDTVSRLAEKYNINQDLPSGKIADKLQQLIEQTKTK